VNYSTAWLLRSVSVRSQNAETGALTLDSRLGAWRKPNVKPVSFSGDVSQENTQLRKTEIARRLHRLIHPSRAKNEIREASHALLPKYNATRSL
jgi:hypothetical protein